MFSDLGSHLKRCVLDEETAPMLSKVFDPKKADHRKKWLLEADDEADRMDYEADTMNLTQFLKTEVKTYSLDSVSRAIPSMCDFLKESQRKIIWASMAYFGKTNNEFKASELTEQIVGMFGSFTLVLLASINNRLHNWLL